LQKNIFVLSFFLKSCLLWNSPCIMRLCSYYQHTPTQRKKIPKVVINRVFFHINFDPLCCHIIFIFSNIWHWYFRTCQFGIFHTRLIWAHIKVVTKLWYFLICNWYAFISNWYAFTSNWYAFISNWYFYTRYS